MCDPDIFVNATGLGMPVVELLSEANSGWVTPVYFNHGDRRIGNGYGQRREIKLGKAYLVSRLQTLLQARRLHLPRTAEAETVVRKLQEYEVRVEANANERYGAVLIEWLVTESSVARDKNVSCSRTWT